MARATAPGFEAPPIFACRSRAAASFTSRAIPLAWAAAKPSGGAASMASRMASARGVTFSTVAAG
jgi:hypothetical protein